MSLTSPIFSLLVPMTSVPLNFDARSWSAFCSVTKCFSPRAATPWVDGAGAGAWAKAVPVMSAAAAVVMMSLLSIFASIGLKNSSGRSPLRDATSHLQTTLGTSGCSGIFRAQVGHGGWNFCAGTFLWGRTQCECDGTSAHRADENGWAKARPLPLHPHDRRRAFAHRAARHHASWRWQETACWAKARSVIVERAQLAMRLCLPYEFGCVALLPRQILGLPRAAIRPRSEE